MAGCGAVDLAIAVASAGGLGAFPCAYVKPEKIQADMEAIRAGTNRPINMNFFCHEEPEFEASRQENWRAALKPYYSEFGTELPKALTTAPSTAFNEKLCALVETLQPRIVSFHFGLPEPPLLKRVKTIGCKILCSATTVAEARFLETHGVDAIIAQG